MMNEMMNMGMNKMQNMAMDNMGNMSGGASAAMNMSGNMQGMAGMDPAAMQGMAGMDPNAMYGAGNHMQGFQNGMQNMQNMPGMDPNAMYGAKSGLLGLGNLDANNLLGSILNLAIDLFVILLFVGLIIGLVVFIKRYVFDGELLGARTTATCANCGASLNSGWKACPKCGQLKTAPVNTAPQTV